MSLSLNCLVLGDDLDRIFDVEIPKTANVMILKKLIKEEKAPHFNHVAASDLDLWKVSFPLDDDLEKKLEHIEPADYLKLSPPFKPLTTFFNDFVADCMHIIVKPPPDDRQLLKRTPSTQSLSSPQERLKRTKLANASPLSIANQKSQRYLEMQEDPSQRILDDRPEPQLDIAPIPLLYNGFGTFLDIFMGRQPVSVNEHIPAIDEFANRMSKNFPNEDERREAGLSALNKIFAPLHHYPLSAASIGSYRSHGHSVGPHNVPYTIVEFKNGLAGISADPFIEAVGYVCQLHVRMDEEHGNKLFKVWRMPCLGITVVGHTITFFAIILIDQQYRVVTLTPGLSCLEFASDGGDRAALRLAFAAAVELRSLIIKDIDRFWSTPPKSIREGTHRFPAISKLRKHGHNSECLEFKITKRFPDQGSYRHLYHADTSESEGGPPKNIVVKFSRTYSVELHEHCFAKGHAPMLLAYEKLPGGWVGIAMEHLKDAKPLNTAKFDMELVELMTGFQQVGLVHGDLRDANILCRNNQFWIIDYDWGGEDGEVEYPHVQLNPELTDGRMVQDMKIRKKDDVRILSNTIAKYKLCR